MVANKAAILAATAVLVEAALGAHGNHHAHIDRRALEIDWVTEWVTVWVTPGQEQPAAATTTTTTSKAAKKHKHKTKSKSAVYAVPTTTSTSIVVVPTSTSVAEADVPYAAPKTTLTTAIKPKYTTSPEAVVEVAKTTSKEAAAAVPTTTSKAAIVEQAVATSKPKAEAEAAATTTTTTSKKAAATGSTSSSSSSLSNKRGLAYNSGVLANAFGSQCDNCGWGYNWDSSSDGLDSTYDYIPQLWSDLAIHTDRWDANVATCFEATNKPKAIFSFNEPDMSSQAAMTPAVAAEKHVEYLNKYAGKALIGAPSVSNSGTDGEGLSWLSSWIDACEQQDEKCQYDFCNIHWYSQPEYSDTLFTQLESAYKLCGKPIWLTEFAPLSTDASAISSFLEEVIPKLEALDYVHAYAYFQVSTGVLMSSESSLSTYGQTYASL